MRRETRQEFLTRIGGLGIAIPAGLLLPGIEGVHEFQRRVADGDDATLDVIRGRLALMRGQTFDGRARALEVAGDCARLIHEICQMQHSRSGRTNWTGSATVAQLLSELHIEQAYALIETLTPAQYGRVVDAAAWAQAYALDARLAPEVREYLLMRVHMVLGGIARFLDNELRRKPTAEIKALFNRCIGVAGSRYQGHPFEIALEIAPQEISLPDKLWCRQDLMKMYAESGQWHLAMVHLTILERELDGLGRGARAGVTDHPLLVRFLGYEAIARVLSRHGVNSASEMYLNKAAQVAPFAINQFQLLVTRCEMLLRSRELSRRLEGMQRLQELLPAAPTALRTTGILWLAHETVPKLVTNPAMTRSLQ